LISIAEYNIIIPLAQTGYTPAYWRKLTTCIRLDVQELAPGDPSGVGREIGLYSKGWLPYTLAWQFRVMEVSASSFALEATGDFVGRGEWRFRQEGPTVAITYDWRIRADKPMLRYLSFVMKPIFSANHIWAMRMGEESLKLELARRHASTPEERARIAAPPGPTFGFLIPKR
jgi:hypothetical protein